MNSRMSIKHYTNRVFNPTHEVENVKLKNAILVSKHNPSYCITVNIEFIEKLMARIDTLEELVDCQHNELIQCNRNIDEMLDTIKCLPIVGSDYKKAKKRFNINRKK